MNSLHPPHTTKPAPRLNPRPPHACSDLFGSHTSGHGQALPTPHPHPSPARFPSTGRRAPGSTG